MYSIEIERSVQALAYCLVKVKNGIDTWDWTVVINAGGIDCGIYFNFDIEDKKLEISNQPEFEETLYLDEIIDEINKYYEDEN